MAADIIERLDKALSNAAIMRTETVHLWAGDLRALKAALLQTRGTVIELDAAAKFSSDAFDKMSARVTAAESRLQEVEKERDEARAYSKQNNDDADSMARGWNLASERAREAEARALKAESERDEAVKALEYAKEALTLLGDPSYVRGEWIGDEMVYRWIGVDDFPVIARTALSCIEALSQGGGREGIPGSPSSEGALADPRGEFSDGKGRG